MEFIDFAYNKHGYNPASDRFSELPEGVANRKEKADEPTCSGLSSVSWFCPWFSTVV